MKWVFSFLIIVFLSSNALAISGVSPASYEVDFESGLVKDFIFDFFIDYDEEVDVYVEGYLAENVELSESEIFGRQKVIATLRFPEEVHRQGLSKIRIIAGTVVGVIKVNLPYSERYVDLYLSGLNANVGEIVDIKLVASNRGKPVNISPSIQVFDISGFKKLIVDVKWNVSWLVDNESFELELDTANYSATEYLVDARVDYGEETVWGSRSFRLGEKGVKILGYTKELKEKDVGQFDIEIESTWNDDIEDVYAEVKVVGSDYGFILPSTKLDAWDRKNMSGFFDTREIEGYNHELLVTLYYDGDSSNEILSFEVSKRFNFVLWGAVGLLVIIVLVFVSKYYFNKVKKRSSGAKKIQASKAK